MAKRKPDEPKKGAPEWQSTFADLMNLLLCFFVLLFSMSTVDAQKYELVAASFSKTFSIFAAGSSMIGDGALIGNGVSQLTNLDNYLQSVGAMDEKQEESQTLDEQGADAQTAAEQLAEKMEEEGLKQSEQLAERIEEALSENQLDNEVAMEVTAQYVQLTMKGSLLFDSGSDQLREEAKPVLDKVGLILERYGTGTIEIEGHTDNVPIHTSRFASNNELSAARALSVFDYLLQTTLLDPAHIKNTGRGEYIPVADNSTVEGRAKNRRVEIKIYNDLSSI